MLQDVGAPRFRAGYSDNDPQLANWLTARGSFAALRRARTLPRTIWRARRPPTHVGMRRPVVCGGCDTLKG